MPGAHRGQKKVQNTLEMELKTIMSLYGAAELNRHHLEEQPGLLTAEQSRLKMYFYVYLCLYL